MYNFGITGVKMVGSPRYPVPLGFAYIGHVKSVVIPDKAVLSHKG